MPWFKVDDQSTFHKKVVAAGNSAWGALVRMGAHSCAQMSDGRVPKTVARLIATPKELQRLVNVGLLTRLGDDYAIMPGGYEIHDFLDYNPSREELEAQQSRKSSAGKLGNARRWGSRPHVAEGIAGATGAAIAGATALRSGAPSPIPSHPIPSQTCEAEPASLTLASPAPGPVKSRKKPQTPCPSSEATAEEVTAWFDRWRIPATDPEAVRLLNWARSKGATYADWHACWSNWKSRTATPPGIPPTGPTPPSRALILVPRYAGDQ